MKTVSDDTSRAAEGVLLDGLRRMSGAERLAPVAALRDSVLMLAGARIREEHGDLPEQQIRLRLAALWIDPATLRRAFGWDPSSGGF